jgi:hypothetical protein
VADTTDLTPAQKAANPIPVPPTPGDLPRANTQLDAFVNTVRLFLRDYAELNRLVDGEESSNRQIMWAIADCLDDFNTTPPFTSFGIADFPSRSLLLRGTVCNLLESIGLLQTRNHLQFSDGGITVGINDKTPFLQSWLQVFRNAYEAKKKDLKVSYNIENAWGGGIFSEFRFINNFYGEW